MTSIKIKKIGTSSKGQISLDLPYKDLKTNHVAIHQVITAYLANQRSSNSHTKTRAEVRATGKKPYKQKGTGYARFGSLVTPIHKGGGIAFGPRNNKNYTKKISKKLKDKVLALILKEKSANELIYQASDIKLSKPSTKEALKALSKLNIKNGDILIITESNNKNLYLSFRNIPSVDVKEINCLNSLDLLTHDNIIFLADAYKKIFTKNIKSKKK